MTNKCTCNRLEQPCKNDGSVRRLTNKSAPKYVSLNELYDINVEMAAGRNCDEFRGQKFRGQRLMDNSWEFHGNIMDFHGDYSGL